MTRPVGLVPAAGRGTRFPDPASIKELLGIPFRRSEEDGFLPVRRVCDFALNAIRVAGAERCAVVISSEKTGLAQTLGSESPGGLALDYLIQPVPLGLPNAVRTAAPWLGSHDVLLALPDTVHFPEDALAEIHRRRLASGADLMLGLFPVSRPQDLGPVACDARGAVIRIYDKHPDPPVRNSWGIASWSGRFTAFCAEWDEHYGRLSQGEPVLGRVFEAASQGGLAIRAHYFAAGDFGDVGTQSGLTAVLDIFRRRGWVADAS